MDVAAIQTRILRAQERVRRELSDLSDDIGPEWEVDVFTSWLDVSTMDAKRHIPTVEITAQLRGK